MGNKVIFSSAMLLALVLSGMTAGGRLDSRQDALAGVQSTVSFQTVPGSSTKTFPETGKTVTGLFLDYWNGNGGLAQQGYPISNAMQEKSDLDGKTYTVQYFERAVFEYHPENQPPYDVSLSQLGTFAYKAKYPQGEPGGGSRTLTASASRGPCEATNDDPPGPYEPNPPVRNSVGKGHTVRGYVLSLTNCAPIVGAKVELWPEVAGSGHDPNDRAAVFTDETGAYWYESRFPEHIHMRISAPGYKTIFNNSYHPSAGQTEGKLDIVIPVAADCQVFEQTGKPLCGGFLKYWQEHGGLAQQGYPISGEFSEKSDLDGKTYTVQYFERAVFEKHPENQPPYDVLLSQLGTFAYKDKYGGVQPAATPGAYTGPAARAGHDMVYDDARKVVLLLNAEDVTGAAEGSPTHLWAWDGKAWKMVSSDGPPVRSLGGAAFDSRRGVLVIDGGVTNNLNYDDTWEWDGSKWEQKLSTPNPGFRHHFLMVYDAERGQIVAYGGNLQADETAQSEFSFPTDTWTWNGQKWTQAATSGPGIRYHYAMAYDSALKTALLFGGSARSTNRNDLWSWDGTKWTEITPQGTRPSTRSSPAMAYDESRRKVVLFGGRVGSSVQGDTWEWDGTKWSQIQVTGDVPPARSHHAMAYDKARRKVVMFGGIGAGGDDNYIADTWEFDGAKWTKVAGP